MSFGSDLIAALLHLPITTMCDTGYEYHIMNQLYEALLNSILCYMYTYPHMLLLQPISVYDRTVYMLYILHLYAYTCTVYMLYVYC